MVDLGNPKVLKNYLIGKMKEGQGVFEEKNVLIYRDLDGMEYIVPQEVIDYKNSLKKEEEKEEEQVKKKPGRPPKIK